VDVYSGEDYKALLRQRVKELGKLRPGFTLKRLAARIPVQYTFLSRSLNDGKTHLNDDHFYSACRVLEFFPEEIDYLSLLRAHALAQDPARKAYLRDRLNRIRRSQKISASVQDFRGSELMHEMGYLFDPLCVLVHVSLYIPEYLANPRALCSVLGIEPKRLQEILGKLQQLSFIECSETGKVERVLQGRIHYGTDHPLMRAHQNLLRGMSAQQLVRVPEEKKKSFMVTFSADEESFRKISARFDDFLKEIEGIVRDAPSRKTWQMNFDLFQWL
jgi:hypothetical protein